MATAKPRRFFANALPALLAGLWLCAPGTAQKTPDEAQRALLSGNQRYAAQRSVPQPLGEGIRRTLARSQNPAAIVITCSDSRVPPEHLFNAGLGELLVVRLAGHVVDNEALASIEHAVEELGVPLAVVLGHDQCAVLEEALAQQRALQQGRSEPASSRVRQELLEQIEPAIRKLQLRELGGRALAEACAEEHAQLTVTDCLRRSPLLRRYSRLGRFRMVAARYQLDSGLVDWLPNRPLPVEEATQAAARQSLAPVATPPQLALRLLQAGNRRFLGDQPPTADLSPTRREQLQHGEQPLAIVLTCTDSRVSPEHLFDAGLGELIVLRLRGGVLTDHALASIEEAVSRTGVSLFVAMGHSHCDALLAAASKPEQQQLSPHARALLARLEPTLARLSAQGHSGGELADRAAREQSQRIVHELRARSALLRRLEEDGRFCPVAAYYDLAGGDVHWLKDGPVPELTEQAAASPAGETAPRRQPADQPKATAGKATAADHGPANQQLALLFEDLEPLLPVADQPATAARASCCEEGEALDPKARPVTAAKADKSWPDPILLLGGLGVASLLLAAGVLLYRR